MNIPNVEFLEKLLVFIGLSLISIGGYNVYINYQHFKTIEKNYDQLQGNLLFEGKMRNNETKKQIDKILKLTKENDRINAELKNAKSNIELDALDSESDSLDRAYQEYSKRYDERDSYSTQKIDSLEFLAQVKRMDKNIAYTDFINDYIKGILLIAIGLILGVSGAISWSDKQNFDREIIIRQNLDKPTYSKKCQSCGKKNQFYQCSR